MSRKPRSLFDPGILRQAVSASFRKLDPRSTMKNPVMFVTEDTITLDQFKEFCDQLDAGIEKTVFLVGKRIVRFRPSLRSSVAVHVIVRRS